MVVKPLIPIFFQSTIAWHDSGKDGRTANGRTDTNKEWLYAFMKLAFNCHLNRGHFNSADELGHNLGHSLWYIPHIEKGSFYPERNGASFNTFLIRKKLKGSLGRLTVLIKKKLWDLQTVTSYEILELLPYLNLCYFHSADIQLTNCYFKAKVAHI